MPLFDFAMFRKKRPATAASAANMPKQVVYFPTKYGDVEALHRWGDEWIISYPWETRQFFGNKESVKAEIARRIEDRYAAETRVPQTTIYIPTGNGDASATHIALNKWKIVYPWAEEYFAGTMDAVRKEMKRKIIDHYSTREAAE